MARTVGFVGFRHGHVYDVYDRMLASAGFRVVACCEEDAETRSNLAREGRINVTHADFQEMLRSVEFDVCVVGDYYARRGALILAALKAGRSVLSDKPVCTALGEPDRIAGEADRKGLRLGAMLDMRDSGIFRKMREIVRGGELGEIATISFNGNHPLLLGKRPSWYFEKGRHGGTINDLGIHAFDMIPWLTGRGFARIEAARTWSTGRAGSPWFNDAAQVMGVLENGCGVLGEMSYLVPDGIAYSFSDYWRFAVTGSKGVLVAGFNDKSPAAGRPGGYLESFLHSLNGTAQPDDATMREVLDATCVSLLFQSAADGARRGVTISRRQS